MATRPAPSRPVLEGLTVDSGTFQFRFAGEANRNYHLQGSTDLVSWTDLLVTNPPLDRLIFFTDTGLGPFDRRFYRVQIGP